MGVGDRVVWCGVYVCVYKRWWWCNRVAYLKNGGGGCEGFLWPNGGDGCRAVGGREVAGSR
jgi:hypothetical protein